MSQKSLVIGKHKPKDQKKTLGRLISYLGESKVLLTVVIIASVLSTLGGLYGAYAISPMIQIIQNALNGVITRNMMIEQLGVQILVLAVIFAIEVATMYLSARLMVKISQRTVETIRKEMFSHVLRMKVSHHDANAHGDLMSRFTNDIDLVGEFVF